MAAGIEWVCWVWGVELDLTQPLGSNPDFPAYPLYTLGDLLLEPHFAHL